MDVLREARKRGAHFPVILMTAYGSVEEAVTAMKEGAFDFIQKPVDLDHLKSAAGPRRATAGIAARKFAAARRVRGALRISADRGRASLDEGCEPDDPARGGDRIDRAAAGRKRNGKGTIRAGDSSFEPAGRRPFVALNCAAIPEGLVENELFGHERGAYTGAGARKIGKMELAHRGTLFLDEIGELPLAMQSKLLRVLEEKRFERVGGTQEIEVNVRILTATNKDLRAAVAEKSFREDCISEFRPCPSRFLRCATAGTTYCCWLNIFWRRFRREFRKPRFAI